MTARLHQFRALSADEEESWSSDFASVAGF
jgi:hypothetical protein